MKKFLLKLVLFFVALIVVDRAMGMVFSYMGDHAKGGYIGHHKYVTDKTNEDILIFGSSRAIHHYNPQIITDSLGMSCYNCGQDGNGIILFYGLWQMIKQHHKPKMIIYDISTSFDLFEGESNQRYLGWLRADYDRPGIKEIFAEIDPTERYKMMSMLYRYNSKFMQNITDYVHPIFTIEGNGYFPFEGEMDTLKIRKPTSLLNRPSYDNIKLDFLCRFIDDIKDVQLCFVASPLWYGSDENVLKPIKEICNKKKIPFIDFSNSPKYVKNRVYYYDGVHLNSKGSDEFTKDVMAAYKRLLLKHHPVIMY